jgi:hypothetical protein
MTAKQRMKRVRGGVVGHALKGGREDAHENGVKLLPSSLPKAARRNPGLHTKGTGPHAGSNPAPSPYKSKWEAAYAAKLDLEKAAGVIKQWWYEPFSLWLPGKVRYKPDFLVQRADPRFVVSVDCMTPTIMEIIEVKGWSRNRRDGITRLKIAAAIYSCFVWRMVYRTKGGGWDGEYL